MSGSDITNLDATDPHEVGEAISAYSDVVARRGEYRMAGNLQAAYEWIQELDQRDYIQALESAVDSLIESATDLATIANNHFGEDCDDVFSDVAKIKEVRKK